MGFFSERTGKHLRRPVFYHRGRWRFETPRPRNLLKISSQLVKELVKGNIPLLRFRHEVPEKVVESVGNESLSNYVTNVCNCQEPNLDTFEIVRGLKSLGFRVFLLSNIGIKFFDDLKRKQVRSCSDDTTQTDMSHRSLDCLMTSKGFIAQPL